MTRSLIVVLVLLAGCQAKTPTEIVLWIGSPGRDKLPSLTVEVATLHDVVKFNKAFESSGDVGLPATLGLLGDGGRRIRVRVTSGALVKTAEETFAAGQIKLWRVWLCECEPCPATTFEDYPAPALDAKAGCKGDAGRDSRADARPPDGPKPERPHDAKGERPRDGPRMEVKVPDRGPDKPKPDKSLDGPKVPDKKVDGPKPDQKVDAPKPDQKKNQPKPPDLPKPEAPKPDVMQPDMVPTLPSCQNGWCFIPKGTFMMGSTVNDPCRDTSDEIYHSVTLSRHFVMAQTEFTLTQLLALKVQDPELDDPSLNTSCGNNCPIENLTWHQAAYLCNLLSAVEKRSTCYNCSGSWAQKTIQCNSFAPQYPTYYECPGYRLPTEAEFEYAARAGTTTMTYGGNTTSEATCANPNAVLDGIAWYLNNSSGTKHLVGQKGANQWGLQDILGNIYEWTADAKVFNLTGYTPDPWIKPAVGAGSTVIVRYGGYTIPWTDVRAGNRSTRQMNTPQGALGFRCVRSLTGTLP